MFILLNKHKNIKKNPKEIIQKDNLFFTFNPGDTKCQTSTRK